MNAHLPENETERLAALRHYAILDTPPELAFERLTSLVARLFVAPIALITLIDQDRQWFKSCYGLEIHQTERHIAFCAHTILKNEVMVVPDATKDPRFTNNPLVVGPPHIRFYAGAPLQTSDGFNLGALCVIDTIPRKLSQPQSAILTDLAAVAVDELELRRALLAKDEAEKTLAEERTMVRSLIDNLPDYVYVKDTESRFLIANRATACALGAATPAAVIGKTDFDFSPPELAEQYLATEQALFQSGRPLIGHEEVILDHETGAQKWVSSTKVPFRDNRGRIIGLVGLNRDITPQKLTELALRESEERYRRIVDTATEGIWMIDTANKTTFVNNRLAQMLGYTAEEMLGQPLAAFMEEEDQAMAAGNLKRRQRELKESHDLKLRRKDGSTLWAIISTTPINNAAGQYLGALAMVTDITERKRSETQFRGLLESAPEAMIIVNRRSKIVLVNSQTEKLFGYSRTELIGKPIEILVPQQFRRTHRKLRNRYLTKPHNRPMSIDLDFYGLCKDGREFPAEISLNPLETEDDVLIIASIRDITERQQAQIENARLYQAVQQELAERNRAREALSQQQAFLRQVIDINPNFIFARDRQGRFTLVNQAVADSYGTTVEELLGKTDADFISDSAEVATIWQDDQAVMDSLKTDLTPEIRLTQINGETHWLQIIKRPLLDEHGVANQVLGIAADITEIKQTEETLRESERKYRSVLDSVKEVIFQTDTAGLWMFLNPAWVEITGFTVEESLGTDSFDYIHPEDRQWSQELHQALLKGEIAYCRYAARYITKNNNFRWLEIYAQLTLTADGLILGTSGTLNDITDRKRAEQALLASETRFRTLATHAPVGIFQTDPHGDCVFVNNRWCELAGILPTEAMGTGWAKALHPDDHEQVFAAWYETAQSGREFAMEYRFRTPTGKVVWVFGNAVSLRNEAREIIGYLGTIADITERKQSELLEKDRNRVLEMVAQNQPLDATLTELVQMVERQRPELVGSVLLLQNSRVYHSAAPSLPSSFIHTVNGLDFNQIVGVRGLATYRGDNVIVSDIAAALPWSEYQELALNHGFRASWSIPIFSSDGAMLGTFTGYYRQPASPSQSDLEIITMASRLAGIAIEQRQLADQLAYQARHDALTGLPNRIQFRDRLQHAIVQARQHEQLVGLLYVDLDRFKLINDTLGHAAGDRLLYQVTQRLQKCIRPGDTLARMGGDEFTIVLSHLADPYGAVRVAQRILDVCQKPFPVIGHELFVTASIGISLYPTDGDNTEELVRKADQALYRSKEHGKNTFQFYTSALDDAVLEQLTLEHQLRGALGRGELLLYYQPQFKVNNSTLMGLEALLRWKHPQLGLVSPASFIPAAEESGLIIPIGAWVLREACQQARRWQQAGYPPLRIAINVSALQFTQADFVETVMQALAYSSLDPRWLQLELTESVLMHNNEDAVTKLTQLKSAGVAIAIDDFGTGYSSLSYLQRLPVDTLKIAQSFVREIGINFKNTPNDVAIITAVTNLAHSLGMRVVAEGVETEQQLELLRSIGSDEMQGYLFSKPRPPAEIEPLLRQQKIIKPER